MSGVVKSVILHHPNPEHLSLIFLAFYDIKNCRNSAKEHKNVDESQSVPVSGRCNSLLVQKHRNKLEEIKKIVAKLPDSNDTQDANQGAN